MYIVQCIKSGYVNVFGDCSMTYDLYSKKGHFIGEDGEEAVSCRLINSRYLRLFPTKFAAQEFIDHELMPETLEDEIAAQFEAVKITIQLAA